MAFDTTAAITRLHTSMVKTMLQNVCSAPAASLVDDVANEQVRSACHFSYLGSHIDSSSYGSPEVLWHYIISVQKAQNNLVHVQLTLLHAADTHGPTSRLTPRLACAIPRVCNSRDSTPDIRAITGDRRLASWTCQTCA